MTRRPLLSTGSLGVVPPLRRSYGTLRLPSVLLATLRCLRLAIPPPRRTFAPSDRRRAIEGIGALVFRAPEPELSVETDGSPRFPGTPRVPWPCSPTPAGPNTPGHCGVSTWSPPLTRTRTPARNFRGSITRPWHSLSTLRSEGHPSPRKTRFRLLGQALPGGIRSPAGFQRKVSEFRVSSSSPELSWRNVSSFFRKGKNELTTFSRKKSKGRVEFPRAGLRRSSRRTGAEVIQRDGEPTCFGFGSRSQAR
jgi:hypothetical protein